MSYRQNYRIVEQEFQHRTDLSFPKLQQIAHNNALSLGCTPTFGQKTMTKKKTDFSQFEQGLTELEQIVQQLEQGDLQLDQALAQFERGITLVRQSQQQLQAAQQKVQILLDQQGEESLQTFNPVEE